MRSHPVFRAALVAGTLSIASVGCASQIYAQRGGYGTYQDVERRAFETGRREGFERGQDDARHRRPFAVNRYGEYRDADQGYRRGEADRDQYRRWFRQGFESGYAEGYNRF